MSDWVGAWCLVSVKAQQMAINGQGDNSKELRIHNRIYTTYNWFSACLYLACTVHLYFQIL